MDSEFKDPSAAWIFNPSAIPTKEGSTKSLWQIHRSALNDRSNIMGPAYAGPIMLTVIPTKEGSI